VRKIKTHGLACEGLGYCITECLKSLNRNYLSGNYVVFLPLISSMSSLLKSDIHFLVLESEFWLVFGLLELVCLLSFNLLLDKNNLLKIINFFIEFFKVDTFFVKFEKSTFSHKSGEDERSSFSNANKFTSSVYNK
jgi:hypothetical protein